MREKEFRDYLLSRDLAEGEINSQVAFIQDLETHLQHTVPSWTLEDVNQSSTQSIVDNLIDRGENKLQNLYAMARYAKAVKNGEMYQAIFQMLDGCEAMEQLYEKLAVYAGEDLRDIIFEDMTLPPLGSSRQDKSRFTYQIINRMETIFEESTTRDILKDSLRILPDELYIQDKHAFHEECDGDIDCYLQVKGKRFIDTLESCKNTGELFFGQRIDDEVIDFVRTNPEIMQGVHNDNVILEMKIPYNTIEYLHETDLDMKRYHYCHCPWAKESLLKRSLRVSPTFCQCSAGFHKKRYEVIFNQTLNADVIKSVLRGDLVCQFKIHLPEN